MKHSIRLNKKKFALLIAAFAGTVAVIILAAVLIGRSAENRRYESAYNSAMSSYIAGQYDDAVAQAKQAAAIRSTEDCATLLARSYAAKGDLTDAVGTLQSWLAAGNSGQAAAALLAEYQAGAEDADENTVEIAGQSVSRDTESFVLSAASLSSADLAALGGLTDITSLTLEDCGLTDLSALSGLAKLETLVLSGNRISDLAPLSGLTALRTLYLDGNDIEDLSPLYELDRLTTLNLRDMDLRQQDLDDLAEALPGCSVYADEPVDAAVDVTLGGKTFKSDVTELDLSDCDLDDLSALAACTALQKLDVRDNDISDLTPLMELPELQWLCVSGNKIADLSPLMGMTGLTYLDVSDNAVTKTSALSGLTALTELYLGGNPLQSVTPLKSLTALTKLGLADTGLDDGALSALSGLAALETLNIEENPDLTGNAVDTLQQALPHCDITHSELTYTVKLGTGSYTSEDTRVDASGKSVSDLSPVEAFDSLKTLLLNDNSISDLSPLSALTGLQELQLSGNSISDIGALENHTKLKTLNLMKNNILDLSALSSCTALTDLNLGHNAKLADLTPLASCKALTSLSLDDTAAADLSPISGLSSLRVLSVSGCPIEDAATLYSLTNLRTLYISGTPLTDEQLQALQAMLPNCAIYS